MDGSTILATPPLCHVTYNTLHDPILHMYAV